MKSYFSKLLFFIVVFATSVYAHEMFWEVNGTKGGKVYILGSLDMGNHDMYPLNGHVMNAFEQSNYLIVELGKGVNNESFIYDQLYVKARYEDNDSIVNHLSPKSYTALGAWLNEHHMESKQLDRFKPWVAAVTLNALDLALRGDEERFTFVNYFFQRARRIPKGVYGIERISQAFERLSDLNETLQEDFLNLQMDRRVTTHAQALERFTNYQEGNRSYFVQKLIEPMQNYAQLQTAFYDTKIDTYVKKIMRYRNNHKGRSYFLIIDLQNLLGERGVIAKLEEADVEVNAY